ncbi:unnamed protein product [Nippostrongylus brasiliensis]|uniref:C-type lectin domain-containing protein n=1 Tax=Nippostrongylus brasiliensis TaxID=27835 RepID=A0A0N4Y0F7_NIPBR|nr:unnamed protein product [Nippostrongylus brasiliensis]
MFFFALEPAYYRGATLPMKISEIAKEGLRAALTTALTPKQFYWIGAASSTTSWRWADGTIVDDEEADWSAAPILPSTHPEAIVLAQLAGWRWIPSAQNVWNSFLCQSKPKTCTFPGISEASRVSFTSPNYVIGTIAVYSCELGSVCPFNGPAALEKKCKLTRGAIFSYQLNGVTERLCDETAQWSGTIPKCRSLSISID